MRALLDIDPHEVRQVLEAKRRWPRPARSNTGAQVTTIWGRTESGRALIVAVYTVSGFTSKIIGSREMTGAEEAEFSQWEETR